MTRRGELTDEAWERIAPLLPENGRRGKQWKDHREVLNGILADDEIARLVHRHITAPPVRLARNAGDHAQSLFNDGA